MVSAQSIKVLSACRWSPQQVGERINQGVLTGEGCIRTRRIGTGIPLRCRDSCGCKAVSSAVFGERCLSPSLPCRVVELTRKQRQRRRNILQALKEETSEKSAKEDVDEYTRKFGLEAGLWKVFTSKEDASGDGKPEKKNQAKELLARYGGAYLATSISLSLVSITVCYALINAGVDVASLLAKVGINVDETGEKVGTFALAYAAHKAASPIRFPPTVALTPVVAGWLGKSPKEKEGEGPSNKPDEE
ncbi:hypothetical protein CBR_g30935 [Chara braunii]|uniref:DUF1279 domain-containing protein n=1 Tax=Chara braunii TaxID=69332 RepID=A0A388LE28_CHABU|nr:hypothetical protein CBR_g30935 [Chara braunii]|eukprot:GBG80473.1 hypothetical protein CBR_g30935 [Chara braunii]